MSRTESLSRRLQAITEQPHEVQYGPSQRNCTDNGPFSRPKLNESNRKGSTSVSRVSISWAHTLLLGLKTVLDVLFRSW